MINQTIQDIIHEINIQRTKSKDSCKTTLQQTINQSPLDSRNHYNHHSIIRSPQSSTSTRLCQQQIESISPDERSCRRSLGMRKSQSSFNNNDKIYRKKWTHRQEQLLCNLIGRYGSDFTFLQTQFPNKTRKQLKKKYQQIHKNQRYLLRIEKIQQSIIRERRKSLFDDEIMDLSPEEKQQKKKKDDEKKNVNCSGMGAAYCDMQDQSQSIIQGSQLLAE